MRLLLLPVGLAALLASASLCAADASQLDVWRGWIADMKTAERGPFSRVLWFCKDGSTQPPVPDGCAERNNFV